MHKAFIIAKREYLALVRTKAFIISLLMMPLFALGGIALQAYFASRVDTGEKKIVVLDGTGKMYEPMAALVKLHNEQVVDKQTDKKTGPTILLEKGTKGPVTDDVRLQLSDLIRKHELFAFIEIDPNALKTGDLAKAVSDKEPDVKEPNIIEKLSGAEDDHDDESPASDHSRSAAVRIYTESSASDRIGGWLRQSINQAAIVVRSEEAELNMLVVTQVMSPVNTQELGLYSRTSNGETHKGNSLDRGVSFLLPFGLMMLMFMSVMVVCQPMISSVLEEKQQRIAEMLLGSASTFQLMLGKLIGNVAVAMTIVAIYLVGGYAVAAHFGYANLLPMWLLGWFIAFEILSIVLYGSLFLAVGAACNELKEAQSMLMPMMILLVLPMMVWFNVIQEPLGEFAKWISLVPPATPMLMLMRLAASPMVPLWQPVLGIVLVLATTVLAVFAGGRVFRIGLLMQGKAPKLTELARWVVRG